MEEITIRYAKIDEFETVNGEQIGMSLYVQGCHFRCPNCFNPDTWDFNGGKEWNKKIENNFLDLVGRTYVKRISILGGCPLANENVEEVYSLIKKLKSTYSEKKIWLYTGYTIEDIISKSNEYKHTPFSYGSDKWFIRNEILQYIDILIDGCFKEEKKDLTLKFRGSSNQRVIDVQKSIKEGKIILHCK